MCLSAVCVTVSPSLLCQMLRHATITKSKLPHVALVKVSIHITVCLLSDVFLFQFQYLQSWLSFHHKTASVAHHNSTPAKKSRTTGMYSTCGDILVYGCSQVLNCYKYLTVYYPI